MQVRAAAIDFLKDYLVDDKEQRPVKGTPEYEYSMTLTRELIKHIGTVELK